MTNNLDSKTLGAGDRAVSKAYLREFGLGMVAYFVALAAMLIWGHLDGVSSWRFAWALVPVLPALWIVVAILRHIRRVDDYQRFLLLQGLGVGFALAMVSSVTLGFLGIAGLDVPMGFWIVYVVGMAGWFATSQILKKR